MSIQLSSVVRRWVQTHHPDLMAVLPSRGGIHRTGDEDSPPALHLPSWQTLMVSAGYYGFCTALWVVLFTGRDV